MELMAAIESLRALKRRCAVRLYTDSKYLQESVTLGWAKRWRAKNWQTREGRRLNWDLWAQLLEVCARHEVEFVWVRGHAGDAENERCDVLSVAAARGKELPSDAGFEIPQSPSHFLPSLASRSSAPFGP